jgi:TatD DNase family protein
MLIDTHCHINIMVKRAFDTYLTDEDYQRAKIIVAQAEQKNISTMINVGTSLVESANSVGLACRFKSVYAAIGIHPNDTTERWKSDLMALSHLATEADNQEKIVAIGECGLDMHYPESDLLMQTDAFKAQVEFALERNLPVIVHTRDASTETLRVLEQFKDPKLRGVIHCFSDDLAFAREAIKMGFVLGIGGPITYPKNDNLRTVVTSLGLDSLILETDAPFLPIQAMRGKENSPIYITDIAEFIAELLQVSPETVAEKTTSNAQKLFNLQPHCT